MGYQHGKSPQPGVMVLNVEQARRRNTELRLELARLAAENAQMEAGAVTMRLQVSAGRRKLSKQIRDLDAARVQAERIAQVAIQTSTLPEPVYGGREGLQAATDEIMAHEAKGLKLAKAPRPASGLSHGTNRKYNSGCRCDECKASESRRNARRYMERRRKAREAEAA